MARPFRFAMILAVAVAWSPVGQAIPHGQPDGNAHPYVGELVFYVPDEEDPRFTDPGAWFSCSGTLVNSTVVVTAGHCTYAVGLNGTSTVAGGGNGGNDVWVSFSEEPDFDGFPLSSDYEPGENAQRYTDRAAFLDANPDWIRGTATSHQDFDNAAFALHDAGVVVLSEPLVMPTYGRVPTLGYLDQYFATQRNQQRFTAVGYGLTKSLPVLSEGGDTRERATTQLVTLAGGGVPYGIVALFSSNNGASHQGGTCFGDSGGPIFDGDTNLIVSIISFGLSPNCTGTTGAYRVDGPDDLLFFAKFGVTPTP